MGEQRRQIKGGRSRWPPEHETNTLGLKASIRHAKKGEALVLALLVLVAGCMLTAGGIALASSAMTLAVASLGVAVAALTLAGGLALLRANATGARAARDQIQASRLNDRASKNQLTAARINEKIAPSQLAAAESTERAAQLNLLTEQLRNGVRPAKRAGMESRGKPMQSVLVLPPLVLPTSSPRSKRKQTAGSSRHRA
jgi:hypothetical protein